MSHRIKRLETPPDSPLINKADIRERLEADMARFFKDGNAIEEIESEVLEHNQAASNKGIGE